MKALTAKELVEAVTPVLPLPGIERIAEVHGSSEFPPGAVHIYCGDDSDWVQTTKAARLVLGAIVEECMAQRWSFYADEDLGKVVVVIGWMADKHDVCDPSMILAACAALAAARKATR